MKIKLPPENPCKSAFVSLSREELLYSGVTESEITLQNENTRLLLKNIFILLRETAGLYRDGNYVTVVCRPLKNGGCLFYIQFTAEPSNILYSFAGTDDLLDALSQLNRQSGAGLSGLAITSSQDAQTIYIPAQYHLSPAQIAILREYSE